MDAKKRKCEDEPSELVPPPLPTSEKDVSKLLDPLTKDQLIYQHRSAAARVPAALDSVRAAVDLDPSHHKLFVHGLGWDTTSEALRAAADLDGNLLVRGFGQSTISDVLRATANLDRKLMVGGFGRNTTSNVLRAAFAPFGEIDDCIVVQDNSTGRSKGYGFVLFRHRAAAIAALCAPEILVEDRRATCVLLSGDPPRTTSTELSSSNYPPTDLPISMTKTGPGSWIYPPAPGTALNFLGDNGNLRKIYVGNVPPDVDGTRLREFFALYGEIEEGPIGFDSNTGKLKDFVLFVYRSTESARKALVESSKNFEGHLLYCESPTGPPPNKAAAAEAIAAQLYPVNVGLNHQATVLDILASMNRRAAARTSANQGPAGYQGNPGSQGAQPPSYESGGGSSY